jgi:hypothetical protein
MLIEIDVQRQQLFIRPQLNDSLSLPVDDAMVEELLDLEFAMDRVGLTTAAQPRRLMITESIPPAPSAAPAG